MSGSCAAPATTDTRFLPCILKLQPVPRSPWQVLECYDRLAAVFKALPVHPFVRRSPWQLHHSTSDVRSASELSCIDCSSMLPAFPSRWDLMTSHKLIMQYTFLCPSYDRKCPGKLIASGEHQTATIRNDGVAYKALGILPALFDRWSTARLLNKRKHP